MTESTITAIEFFSGMGAFAEAARFSDVEIIQAFDQSQIANLSYRENFQLSPNHKNLDSIKPQSILGADLWWLSPPCSPYTVRGNRLDHEDMRAKSFLNLIECLRVCLPKYIFVENVLGFKNSTVQQKLVSVLVSSGYAYTEIELCSSLFGVPMFRPRLFMVATKFASATLQSIKKDNLVQSKAAACISDYLDSTLDADLRLQLTLEKEFLKKYESAFHIIDCNADSDQTISCITHGYPKSARMSGSYLREEDSTVRRLAPNELLKLFGFSHRYRFPKTLTTKDQLRLIGNTVDVRAIKFLLSCTLDGIKYAPREYESQSESA